MVFDGHKVKKKVAFKVGDGQTRSISDGVTRFLGSLFTSSAQANRKEAGKALLESFFRKLSNLDRAPLRGEYNCGYTSDTWYIQSIYFFLSVNNIPSTTIS